MSEVRAEYLIVNILEPLVKLFTFLFGFIPLKNYITEKHNTLCDLYIKLELLIEKQNTFITCRRFNLSTYTYNIDQV